MYEKCPRYRLSLYGKKYIEIVITDLRIMYDFQKYSIMPTVAKKIKQLLSQRFLNVQF